MRFLLTSIKSNKILTATLMTAIFLVVFPQFVLAQVSSSVVSSRRAELEQELLNLESEISAQKKILEERQRERVSLERDVAIIDANIEKSRLGIKQTNLYIQKLNEDISGKDKIILNLDKKLARERESLAQIIRRTNEVDSYSMAEVVLSSRDISKFFDDVDYFSAIESALKKSYETVKSGKANTEAEKEVIRDKIVEEIELRKVQELEKTRLEQQEAEKQRILKVSKGVEAEYQKIIVGKEKNATAIRTELFTLRGTAAIPFEKAYEYAMVASKKTGVRAALILGIIAEESNLGENVGTGTWRVDMANPRDTVPFKDICARLGFDPDKMPVSKKPWYGYGGAMGPAQFIPSTWILYEDRIADATGHRPPNPWNPEDAFMASAILLDDNGASAGTASAERLAALRYLAGWKNATKKAYAFYGDDVMDLATKYQSQINILQQS